MQKSLLSYVSYHLSFIDPIDRALCIERFVGLLSLILQELNNVSFELDTCSTSEKPNIVDMMTQIGSLNLVVVAQLCQIAKHDSVSEIKREQAASLKVKIARFVLALILQHRFCAFTQCLVALRPVEGFGYTIWNDQEPIQALIICWQLLRETSGSLAPFWDVVNDIYPSNFNESMHLQSLEKRWKSLFVLLPFLEFDSKGIIETGRRFELQCDNWTPIKQITGRVLEVYLEPNRPRHPAFNSYCRTLFARCLHLISDWNWAKCEGIIGTLFDFFARNNLSHLKNEECHGSPGFLEHLAENPSLEPIPGERCFHIFLKILAKGLLKLRSIHPAKKIRDIVWRLMPNHGRFHPKEEAIHQEDLDALRNHHDLLATLYWASPPVYRPPLTVVRNLVHVETSHKEACHLNIRTWSNLVRFQLSTQEPLTNLSPFADWHDDLVVQLLRQHTLARSEAEQQVRLTEHEGGLSVNRDMLESTISRNQRQVEAMLDDALVSLKLAIAAARDSGAAIALLSPETVSTIRLFNAQRPQVNGVIERALDVFHTCTQRCAPDLKPNRSSDSNDDSQEYGDWSFAEDGIVHETSTQTASDTQAVRHLQSIVEQPLRLLVSNAFGADTQPKDGILVKIIDTWTAVAALFVRAGLRSWSDYLGPFGQDSWSSLRTTQQTRRYTTYFLAGLADCGKEAYSDHRDHFLRSWIESLVERESLLKFQHRLTSIILNLDKANPLLRNLPFWTDKNSGQYCISASDFSLRRLSLISSVLSNMRELLDNAGAGALSSELRQEYKELLKHLMNAMKHNYQELESASNIRGAYVTFAQRVVEFLQQHTSAICSVDRFFTDSSAFPLPLADPLYVVGQLKNYGLRLQDPRTPKQLAVFLQSVFERTATEGHQEYLVGQLSAAMSDGFEHGDRQTPTLRAFLIEAIVPAYVEVGFTSSNGWILLSPWLQALRLVFMDMLNYLDGTDAASMMWVTSMIFAFVDSLRRGFQHLVDDTSVLGDPHMLHIIGEAFSAITALLPTVDYIIRLNGAVEEIIPCIRYFQSFASLTSDAVDEDYDFDTDLGVEFDDAEIPHKAVRCFAQQELKQSLSRNWTLHDERYYVVRGNTRKEVRISSRTLEEERGFYHEAVRGFFDCMELCRPLDVVMEARN